ncbi:MAG: leucine-rich repeat protein [Eubacteriales bacterium]|uniref:leucine-rich repeat protein n=1 Tax=Enterococcus faecium TaxID=1352 RepID=UPI0003B8B9C8|nr:leucine-rich repeat protein [Enterococcus faecium]ERT38281.1 hypothetical protein O992_00712 [Enterococcus faecium NEF1]MCU1994995.1 leucine-rich repeat protein [Enterococcus faecium]MDO5539916.1 leucine-rich repeat protein [Eubacteriales bacterium]
MKQTKKSRLLAILLSAAMLLSMLPTVAFAEETESIPAEQCTVTEGCTLEDGHEGACAVAEPETEPTAELETEPIAEPTEKPPADPTETLTTAHNETDEMTEPISADDVLLSAELATSGSCGATESDNVSWALTVNNSNNEDPTYTLTISGTGAMADYAEAGTAPWCTALPEYQSKITEIIIGKDITIVGSNAFVWCSGVKTVTFESESRLEQIKNQAFHSLNQLSSIEFPASLTEIGQGAFYKCESLVTVTFQKPESLLTIGSSAFGDCTSLQYFNNPEQSATHEIIPVSVTEIGQKAFQNCSAMIGQVTIPAEIETLSGTFWNCAISKVTFESGSHLKKITDNAFSSCKITEVTLPEGLEEIGPNAFYDVHLTSIQIPASVTSIGDNAFLQKTGSHTFSSVTFAEGSALKSIGSNVFGRTGALANIKSIALPEGLETISATAFQQSGIESITVPSTVTSIGNNAFYLACKNAINLSAVSETASIAGCTQNVTRGCMIYLPSETVKNNLSYSGSYEPVYLITNGGIVSHTEFKEKTLVDPVREGFTFGGWYESSSFTGSAVNSVENGKTYYAKWNYSIAFDANGGSGSMSAQQVTEGDSQASLSQNTFTRTGYTFSSWNTAADGSGTTYESTALASSVYNGTTLYAQWKPNTYTISFDAKDGQGTMSSITATYDKPAILPSCTYSKSEYSFAGWTTSEDGASVQYSDCDQLKNLIAENNGTVTLYAVWTTKGVLNPDVNVQTKTYNGQTQSFTVDNGFTVTYEQNGVAVDSPANAGSYDVTVVKTETDNTAAYHHKIYGGLVIQPAAVTITAEDQRICVGGVLPSFTYTVSGLVNSDSLMTEPMVACVDADANTAGSYTIVASGASAGDNYEITFKSGTLVVQHMLGRVEGRESTCTEKGYESYWKCSVCDKLFSDENGTTEIEKPAEVEAKGHAWGEWETVTSPNCTDKGSQKRTCSVCNVVETKDVEPNGHDWNEKYTVDKQPTTTEDGSKSIHCKSCNVVKDSTVIPAIGQQPAEVNPEGALSNRTLVVSEATSTDKQSLTDAVKNQYKDKFSGKELWMLDINLIDTSVWEKVHDETVTFTLGYPAGITDDNYQNYDFVVLHQKADGSMELSNFVATAHGLKITSTLSPFAIGYSERHTHSYGDWKSDANGHWHECDCGSKADEGVHTFSWIIDKEATAAQKGSKHEECTVCHYKKAAVEIPALGGNTDNPSKPNGGSSQTGNPSKPSGGSPQTGDNSNVTLWISVMVVSLICLFAVLLVMKKKTYRRKWEK